MEIKAPLKKAFIENYGEGKQKLIAVFDTNEQFKEILAVTFYGDKVETFEKLNAIPGDVLEVKCNVKSREASGRYYTEATAWFVKKVTN
jgi:hypothetical protein